jgi:hypothetical protein
MLVSGYPFRQPRRDVGRTASQACAHGRAEAEVDARGAREWAKRVERWRDSGLTTAEFAAELGINSKTLTCCAWTLERAPSPAFVELPRHGATARFKLEVRGRRLHIPSAFDAQQLRALLEILETA